jgi:hypothetical protein
MANITAVNPGLTGTAPTIVTAGASGDIIVGASGAVPLWIRFINADGAAVRTITFDDPTSSGPSSAKQFDPDVAVTVPISSTRVVKLDQPSRFFNATGGIAMTYSANASLTFEVYQ